MLTRDKSMSDVVHKRRNGVTFVVMIFVFTFHTVGVILFEKLVLVFYCCHC